MSTSLVIVIIMNSVELVNRKYAEGREYNPSYGGPFPIEDWIMIKESERWIKGAERINEGVRGYRIRFVYWELKDKGWGIHRLHPIMDTSIAKKLVDEMIKRNWI